jgi:two-component system response regulator
MREIRILMVDDHEDDMILAREMFDDAGFGGELISVGGAREAREYLETWVSGPKSFEIGVIFLDINMPIKNGFEFLDELKAHPEFRKIPVMMVSGSSREEEKITALQKGAAAYITKPIGFDQLVEGIRSLPLCWTLSVLQIDPDPVKWHRSPIQD